jgi:hypothetical protein
VGTSDKADPDLRRTLDRLGKDETLEVLVYPTADTEQLVAYLATRRDTGDLQFNLLELANCIALRAPRATIDEVLARSDVARVTINPTFTANDPS